MLIVVFLSSCCIQTAADIMAWNENQINSILIGRLMFTSMCEYQLNKRKGNCKFAISYAILLCSGEPLPVLKGCHKNNAFIDGTRIHPLVTVLDNSDEEEEDEMIDDLAKIEQFPRKNHDCDQAVLLLLKEKCNKYLLIRVR